jgi:hypothetical protein
MEASGSGRLSPQEFIQRWAGRKLTERQSAQPHFIDLCHMLGVAAPTDNRINDSNYGFEAKTDISASGVYATRIEEGLPFYRIETGGGPGFADVWMRDHFAWEYKRPGKHPTLESALGQLRIYAPSLGNPPLLIVSDIDRYEIHTNFTNYPPTTYSFHITELVNPSDEWRQAHPHISPLELLRKVFEDPTWFRPAKTRQAITAELAKEIGDLAKALRDAGNEPHGVAHFLMQIVFCFFAEDIGLLPRKVFTDLIEKSINDPASFPDKARALFKAMELGGHFGAETIEWFNGGLYQNIESDPVIRIAPAWLGKLLMVGKADWNAVDPTIFGTLFERSLDPDKRSQIGAHYTSYDDIMLIVEPVIMQPLRREWVNIQKDVAEWVEQRAQPELTPRRKGNLTKKIHRAIEGFCDELAKITILDPACGSGNFLYVAIQQLLSLEQDVLAYAARPEVGLHLIRRVQPRQVRGIDVNDYACELARVSIWIGYLQWMHANAAGTERRPILDPLDTIENRDAILAWDDENGEPLSVWREGAVCTGPAEWPKADCIVGNPPFLGFRLFGEHGLPREYVSAMHGNHEIPRGSDLCCYWFEHAVKMTKKYPVCSVGLLATQGIRGGDNRKTIELVTRHATIFCAWSDREWILEGAAVRISIICFTASPNDQRLLDGAAVPSVNADLSAGSDLTSARRLAENRDLGFQGTVSSGDFDMDWQTAKRYLESPNPVREANTAVVRPWSNGQDVTRRARSMWIVDFATITDQQEAAAYELPFEHVAQVVKPQRDELRNGKPKYAHSSKYPFWLLWRPREEMRGALRPHERYIATPTLTKHRVFVWFNSWVLPSHQLIVYARSDDYFFGVLHSSAHAVWALRMGTQFEDRPRYTPTTCFETFPLPWPPGEEPEDDPRYIAIADAAKQLNELRENWLNPPEWIKPIEDAVDRFEDFSDVPAEARPLLRHSAIMARAAKDRNLKKRTLTNLYNERPSWLKLAHRRLDEAVIAAYAAVDTAGDWDPAWAEAYEPFGAGEITIIEKGKHKDPPEVVEAKRETIERRREADQLILANLLRLNQERAAYQDDRSL